MRLISNPRARTSFLVLLLVVLLVGDAWRYLIGWLGFSIVAGLIGVASVALLVAQRRDWRFATLPYPLIAFVAVATASLLWSFYPGATAFGLLTTVVTIVVGLAVAVTFTWADVIAGLGHALRIILGLSFLFELVVSVFVRQPVLPLVPQPGVDYSALPNPIPPMLYWSRDELFTVLSGGKMQGIAGNSTLLSFVALIAIIVFAVQLADAKRRRWPAFWLVVAALAFLFSRSATNIIGLVVVAAVIGAVLLLRRAVTPRDRVVTYIGIVAVGVLGVILVLVARVQLLGLLGKGEDLTNRTQIWHDVIELALERPVAGWGWVSYWVPWVAPFDTLAFNNGVRQLHAHNAWIDVWFQLGILGVIVFGALVLSTFSRAWSFAVDRRQFAPHDPQPFRAAELLPLAILVALLVQSLAESRLLVEFGMFALVLIAVKTKAGELHASVRLPR